MILGGKCNYSDDRTDPCPPQPSTSSTICAHRRCSNAGVRPTSRKFSTCHGPTKTAGTHRGIKTATCITTKDGPKVAKGKYTSHYSDTKPVRDQSSYYSTRYTHTSKGGKITRQQETPKALPLKPKIPPSSAQRTHRYPFRHQRQQQLAVSSARYANSAKHIYNLEANAVLNPLTGVLQEFRHLIKRPDKEIWTESLANKFCCLAQGVSKIIDD